MREFEERMQRCGPHRWIAAALILLGTLVAAAPAPAAFPGANGRIAFQGYQSLGTVNQSGGDRQPLIGQSGVVFATPTWSPDGQRLAFASNRDGADFEIYVTDAGGATVTPLTTNSVEDGSPAWSPDGRRIAFESNRGGQSQIYVMNGDGTGVVGTAASVLEDHAPAWSPDGTRIAFARGPADSRNIWVMGADGAAPTPLTSDPADETNPDWSPDNARIAFQRNGAIVVMGADGGGQTPLPVPAGSVRPAWAPDGTRIAFDVFPELYVVNPDGTGVTPLTSGGSTTLLSQAPTWQPIPAPVTGGGTPSTTPSAATPLPPGFPDADGDGAAPPFDCNDADPSIRPGAVDIPRDQIDQDCSGRDARFRVLDRRVEAFLSTYPAGYTIFTSMVVKPVRAGDVLRLTCKGRGCPLAKKTVKVKKQAAKLSLLRHLRGARLRRGAVVQLRVTRPGTIGRVARWEIVGRPRNVKITRRCLEPGAKKLSACPAA